ncbi:MAG: hypothetical protein DRJ97_01410 [Thermoprotei archaeon]|nr:MAG: hypothetical protein DRJ97_01410 [Thermoprotei archaeon]
MARALYRVNRRDEEKEVELYFEGATVTFEQVKEALSEVKEFFDEGYRVRIKGYLSRRSEALEAFMFAVEFLGFKERLMFEERARYHKAERRTLKGRVVELSRRGLTVKEIASEVKVPLKTIYRWLKEERMKAT